jgi:hypothetical protein
MRQHAIPDVSERKSPDRTFDSRSLGVGVQYVVYSRQVSVDSLVLNTSLIWPGDNFACLKFAMVASANAQIAF